ncbi:MAG: DUF1415 domain-containing protein [Pseudomonadota bacterium]
MESPHAPIIQQTRDWIERFVIGLNLCPFAGQPWREDRVRITASEANTPEALAEDLAQALMDLAAGDPQDCETTLLVHPQVLQDFLDYNDFLDVADELLDQMGLDGEFQIASFHPHYQFADTDPEDRSNATNRSPYPMLHLLREASVEAATARLEHPEAIYERNIRTLQGLDPDQWAALFDKPAPGTGDSK